LDAPTPDVVSKSSSLVLDRGTVIFAPGVCARSHFRAGICRSHEWGGGGLSVKPGLSRWLQQRYGGPGAVRLRRGLRVGLSAMAALLLTASSSDGRAALSWSGRMSLEFGRMSSAQYIPGLFHVGVSCASPSLCIVVDTLGQVISSTNPTGGPAAWSVVKIVNSQAGLGAVSCPSASLCVATANIPANEPQVLFVSSHPAAGRRAWRRVRVDTGGAGMTGVSCPSANLCVVATSGRDGVVSTRPTGGTPAWHTVQISSFGFVTGVSCASTKLCVAVSNVGRGGLGPVFTSTRPASGAAWTGRAVSDIATNAVSCSAPSLCVAGGQNGDLLVSGNPAGGTGAWKLVSVRPVSRAPGSVLSVSCASVLLCVAGNNFGDVITSTRPRGGAAAWGVTKIDSGGAVGLTDLTGMSCPSPSLCIAVDSQGAAILGQASGRSQLKAELVRSLVPPRAWRTRGRLIKQGGYAFSFDALTRGTGVIDWYYMRGSGTGRGKPQRVLVAAVTHDFAAGGPRMIKVKLTASGRHVLRSAASLHVTAQGSFRPMHGSTVRAARNFTVTG
jgi:hypothetical protein